MSFIENLRVLRASKKKKEVVLRREAAEKSALEQKELAEERALFDELVEFTNERLIPLFNEVNNEYLNGEGEIEISPSESNTDIISGRTPPLCVSLSLRWDIERHRRWEELEVTRVPCLIILRGGKYNEGTELAEMEFNLEDENWEEELKDGILKYLSTPKACLVQLGGAKPREDN